MKSTLHNLLGVCGAIAISAGALQCGNNGTNGSNPDLSSGTMDMASSSSQDLSMSPAPTITTVAPALGANTGGTNITITGTGFEPGATVTVAGAACSQVMVVSATSITCTTPAKAATCGAVPIVVTNPDTQSANSNAFSYTSAKFSLAAGVNVAAGATSRSAVWADFNGDGIADIGELDIPGGVNTAIHINVQLGNGDGTFQASKTTAFGLGQDPLTIAVGDMDNNGAPDLVAILNAGSGAATVLVMLGQKDGTFKPQAGGPVALTKNSTPAALAIATADNKAKPYVVVAGTSGGKANLDVLSNDGTGVLSGLTATAIGANGTAGNHLMLADINNDKMLDALVVDSAAGNVRVLTGNGAGTFTAVAMSPFTMGTAPNHVLAVDLDNDGKLDMVASNTGNGTAATIGVSIRKGDGQGGFGNAASFSQIAAVPTNLTSADFNVDGNADIAVSHAAAAGFSYLLGKGAIGVATFQAPALVAMNVEGAAGDSVVAAQFHTKSDGLYDVVTPSNGGNNLSISLNVCQ